MTQRARGISPQLRALGPEIRVLAAYLDAFAAYGRNCPEVEARVDTAELCESGDIDGWHQDPADRLMQTRGWVDADSIYNSAGIPEKHRRVIDLALWQEGEPTANRKGHFSLKEISELTGHPVRTVQLWLHNDIPRLRRLAEEVA